MKRALFSLVAAAMLAPAAAQAQVTYDRLLKAEQEPQNWLTYSGTYKSHRYSPLTQITPANVKNLDLQWVFQVRSLGASDKFEATPLVVDGVMYTVSPPNDVVALDAITGRVFWRYNHAVAPAARVCCGRVNRGLAILGDRVFMGTIDGRVLALNAKTGAVEWNVAIGRPEAGYSVTVAPLVIKDKLILGPAGGEYGIRGFILALDPKDGKELWRFNTVPGPGEPGHDTWGGDSWMRGGGPIWTTGSYDPELNLTYWGVGNPGPDWNGDARPGDNLYTESVIALDPDTGTLKWHYQFTPHDEFDYDSTQIPVLADIQWQGSPRKVMLWANRNGIWYVIDRTTGQFLQGKPFTTVNWVDGFDAKGRPNKVLHPTPGGHPDLPEQPGGDQLVLAVVQPAHRLVLHPDLGGHLLDLPQDAGCRLSALHRGAAVHRHVPDDGGAGAGAAADQRSPAAGRLRLHSGVRPQIGRAQVGIQDGRRHRQRCAVDGIRPRIRRRP